jgi:hypothetical protein
MISSNWKPTDTFKSRKEWWESPYHNARVEDIIYDLDAGEIPIDQAIAEIMIWHVNELKKLKL